MFNGTKIATANGLSSDFCKAAFDMINPGAARRGKMQNVSRSVGKPVAHSGRLVSGQIIQHIHAKGKVASFAHPRGVWPNVDFAEKTKWL